MYFRTLEKSKGILRAHRLGLGKFLGPGFFPLRLGNLAAGVQVDEGALLVPDHNVEQLVAVYVYCRNLRADP